MKRLLTGVWCHYTTVKPNHNNELKEASSNTPAWSVSKYDAYPACADLHGQVSYNKNAGQTFKIKTAEKHFTKTTCLGSQLCGVQYITKLL